MATTIEVIFSGLALFCMNHEGALCEGKKDVVYLVNGADPATVCGRDLDGGHEPRISFDAGQLYSASYPYRLVKTGPTREHVTASLAGVDLCVCVDRWSGECPEPGGDDPGAEPLWENVKPGQEDPQMFQSDEESFAWLPNLKDLARVTALCPKVEDSLSNNVFVAARVWLDDGTVLTEPDWSDRPGKPVQTLWWKITENDYLKYRFAAPGTDPDPSDMRRALPGHVMWRLEESSPARDQKILLNDCSDRNNQKPLFRLEPTRQPVRIFITNGPRKKPLAPEEGDPLNHFQWYYRLVYWGANGCDLPEPNSAGCGDPLPLPHMPQIPGLIKARSSNPVDVRLIVGDKCPPANGG